MPIPSSYQEATDDVRVPQLDSSLQAGVTDLVLHVHARARGDEDGQGLGRERRRPTTQ